ncbi:MAG TPA: carboxypeptidase-like regulatory domain-containing protein [Terriglobales bacterium]|nr:carboxypeptidase-like regulatory domain-containing protein [Terriglobales bacterium]
MSSGGGGKSKTSTINSASLKRKLRGVKSLTAFLVLLLTVTAQSAFPCSLSSLKLRQVPSNITVKVTHSGRPIAGIGVEIVPEAAGTDPVFHAETDESGTVQVTGLMVGKYYLTASHLDFEAGREWIEVVSRADARTVRSFNFQWADDAWKTSSVTGSLVGMIPGDTGNKIMDLARPKETVYPGVAVILKSAFSDAEYHTLSDSNGSFVLPPVPDGIYVLTIAGGMTSVNGIAEETTHVVDLRPTASRSSLRLSLSPGVVGCYGIGFKLSEK